MGRGDEDNETGQDGRKEAVENHPRSRGLDSGHQVPVVREKVRIRISSKFLISLIAFSSLLLPTTHPP